MTDEVDSHMDPAASPSRPGQGVRRVNNVPVAIFGAAVGLFGVVIAYVAIGRAASSDGAKSDATVRSARSVAEEITRPYEAGEVQAESAPQAPASSPSTTGGPASARPGSPVPSGFPAPPPPPGTTGAPEGSSSEDGGLAPPKSARGTSSDVSSDGASPGNAPDELEQMRLEMFKAAVRSKTTVQVTGPSDEQPTDSDRAQQSAARADGSYVERLRALQEAGFLPAAEGAGARPRSAPGYGQFDAQQGEDRWSLGSRVEAPRTAYELRAGAVLPATLTTGINSDLPGQITAIVAQDVRDTATGDHVLIPQGCKLVGTYAADVKFGQDRLLVAWQRIVFPDGKALDIGAMPGADGAGYAGFEDQVDNHYFRLFASAILMSGITGGIAMSQSSVADQSGRLTLGGAMTESLGQQLGQLSEELIRKQMNVAPTIEIRPGYRFTVQVTKDLTFNGPYRAFDYERAITAARAAAH